MKGFLKVINDCRSLRARALLGLAVLVMLLPMSAFADRWVTQYPTWGLWTRFGSVAHTPDGGFILGGMAQDPTTADVDVFVAKLNVDYTVAWTRRYGGVGRDLAYGVSANSDGSYTVVGSSGSQTTPGFHGFVTKLSSTGGVDWHTIIQDPVGNGLFLSWVAQTADGGFIVVGGVAPYYLGLWKLSLGGSVTGFTRINYTGDSLMSPASAVRIIAKRAGRIVVTGVTGTDKDTPSSWDTFILEIDEGLPPSPVLLNARYDAGGIDTGEAIAVTPGGFVVTGRVATGVETGTNLLVFKVRRNGSVSWAKSWGGSTDKHEFGTTVLIEEPHVLVAGRESSLNPDGVYDASFLHLGISRGGRLELVKILRVASGTADWPLASVKVGANFLFLGTSGFGLDPGHAGEPYNPWLMKLDSPTLAFSCLTANSQPLRSRQLVQIARSLDINQSDPWTVLCGPAAACFAMPTDPGVTPTTACPACP